MHKVRVMHRDIKPANIFIGASGAVKLGDLGLGRAFSTQTFQAISKVGTPLYMSPEVLDGRGYEWKSDIWSLGCLLYELCTLRSPFKSTDEKAKDNLFSLFGKISKGNYEPLPSHSSPSLLRLVGQILQIDPAVRPNAEETLAAAKAAHKVHTHRGNVDSSASSQSGSMRNDSIVAHCDFSDNLTEKLKLLNYEIGLLKSRALPPLVRHICFTSLDVRTPTARFYFMYNLICWLLQISIWPDHTLWDRLPESASDCECEQAAIALVREIINVGEPLASVAKAVPLHRLRGAQGDEVCNLLEALVDFALKRSGFRWGRPRFVQHHEDQFHVEMESVARAEEFFDDNNDDDCPSTWDIDHPFTHLGKLSSNVNPVAWAEEFQRIQPLLTASVTTMSCAQMQWRHRRIFAKQQYTELTCTYKQSSDGLDLVAEQASHIAAVLSPLYNDYVQAIAKRDAVTAPVREGQERVLALAEVLKQVQESLNHVKQQVAELVARLSDATVVEAVNKALRGLRAETCRLLLLASARQGELSRWRRCGRLKLLSNAKVNFVDV